VLCGVKVTVSVQLAPGTMLAQLLETVKSGVVCTPRMLSVAVPVLSSVTVCGALTLPTMVLAKVRELCDGVIVASGAAFEGDETVTGVELPVRSIRSGLDAASLSITSSPLSVVETGGLEPDATWLIGV
jgi:hypothetical protein